MTNFFTFDVSFYSFNFYLLLGTLFYYLDSHYVYLTLSWTINAYLQSYNGAATPLQTNDNGEIVASFDYPKAVKAKCL